MGCAMLSQQKPAVHQPFNQRGYKKSHKIDGRKKSTQSNDQIRQNVTIISQKLSPWLLDFACKTLKQHALFCTLQEKQIFQVANLMHLASGKKGQYIFKQGDTGVCFFIIKEGEVDLQIGGNYTKTLKKNDCFGELALIYFSKRTASAKCKSDNLQLILIKSKPFKAAMIKIRQSNNERTKNLIQNVQIFSLLTTKQKYTMLNCLVREQYRKGSILFHKNDVPVSFYIIESGKVNFNFNDPKKTDITLGELQSFGESAFKLNAKRQGTAIVQEDLVCLTINQDKMKQCLGNTLSNIVYHNIKKWALKSCRIFSNLDNRELDQVAMQFTAKTARSNQIIGDMDKPVDSLIICIEGKVNSKPPGTMFNEQHFKNGSGKLDKDIIKNDTGVYAVLEFDKLKQILATLHSKGSLAVAKKRQSVIMKQNQQVLSLNSLDYLTKLGEGQFGLVHLVKDRKTGNLFALKCLQKQKIKKEAMQESAVSQRDILASICHPLIVGYYKAYEDKSNIYFLLQYIYGMEMFEAIRQIGILNKVIARFYFGSLLLAVQYLHSRNIIYRDIKPQNSIVNSQGKVYLIDMGTAKQMKSGNGYRTDTIIGTPHYMAPEVMQGKGYSFEADFWSLGILFFELICGHLPFAENIDNPYQVYAQIMQSQVVFPHFVVDEQAKTIIRKLLNKNIQARAAGGLISIKNAPYFQNFSWEDLYDGKMVPPFVPKKYRNTTSAKYSEMVGSPLVQFLHEKKKKPTQQIKLWTNNFIQ